MLSSEGMQSQSPSVFWFLVAVVGIVHRYSAPNLMVFHSCWVCLTFSSVLRVSSFMCCSYGSNYMEAHSPPIEGSLFQYRVSTWITAFNVITLSTNVLATSKAHIFNLFHRISAKPSTVALSYCIWRINGAVAPHVDESSSLFPIMRIILESGAIYACAVSQKLNFPKYMLTKVTVSSCYSSYSTRKTVTSSSSLLMR